MLQVRPFDIEIGQHKVMLNAADAREREALMPATGSG